MYELEWVQKLIRQIQHCLQMNSSWLGINQTEPQRVLDYACGDGTVSTVSTIRLQRRDQPFSPSRGFCKLMTMFTCKALLTSFPQALFRGLDIAASQVERFNEKARTLNGHPRANQKQMWAIQGDINEPDAAISTPEWSGFDVAIISMALHHVKDPADFMIRLRQRVRQGGTLVIIDWLRHVETADNTDGNSTYNVADMTKLPEGMSIWPGFSIREVHSILTTAACTAFEVKVYPESIDTPSGMRGYNKMFIARATVL